MTIVIGIWIYKDSLSKLKTEKGSKEWFRKQNETSLMGKSMRSPTRSVVLGNS